VLFNVAFDSGPLWLFFTLSNDFSSSSVGETPSQGAPARSIWLQDAVRAPVSGAGAMAVEGWAIVHVLPAHSGHADSVRGLSLGYFVIEETNGNRNQDESLRCPNAHRHPRGPAAPLIGTACQRKRPTRECSAKKPTCSANGSQKTATCSANEVMQRQQG